MCIQSLPNSAPPVTVIPPIWWYKEIRVCYFSVCAQGYLGCTAVDWRNHTCLKWSDKKVQTELNWKSSDFSKYIKFTMLIQNCEPYHVR